MAFQLSMHLRKLNNFNSKKNTFFSKISDQEPSMLVLGGSIGTDQKVDVFSNTFGQVFNFDEPSKAIFQQSSDQEPSMLVLDGSIGTDQTIDLVSKNIGKSFDFNRSAKAILQDTTDFEIQKVHSDWFDFTKNSTLAGFKPHKIRRIIDASGDGSLAEVFENGALKINLNSPGRNPFRKIGIGRHGEINLQGAPVQVSIEARDLETGDVIDLGTQSINQTQSSLLVDLKDKINAVSSGSLRDQYSVSVTKFTGSGQQRNVIESFRETITVIKPMQFGSNHLGDETSNDFTYQDFGSAFGSARIFQGRGGTDTLHLDGVDSSDVSFFNGRRSIDAQSASELGKQSFYGGTVFDSLGLNNGDELYLQGVERLQFDDVTIDLTPDQDARSDNQWNTQVMDVNGAWRFNTGSEDVVLVSLDTGFDANGNGNPDVHSDLAHVSYQTAVNSLSRSEDHGHQAMSVMAAAHDDSEVAGVAPDAGLWGYNVYAGGVELQDAISDAISNRSPDQKLVFQGGVQGESWWTNGGTESEMNGLFNSSGDFSFFSIAAGNGGPGGNLTDSNYLTSVSGIAKASSSYDHIASVGALQATSWEFESGHRNAGGTRIAPYSNRGSNLTLVAPTNSDSILNSGGSIRTFGGTSCANPNLAGVAALVWSENGALDGGELREIMIGSAMDLGTAGFDSNNGFGLVNAEGAVRRAHALDQNAELASFWTNQDFLA
jgi:hypothetical protein